jgi:hypothetical protein
MAWVSRGGKAYYYCKRKVAGRVFSEYFGSGPEAELAAALDARRRQERQARRRAGQLEHGCWERAVSLLGGFAVGTALLVQSALLLAGYRQHQRGAWRKRRQRMTVTDDDSTAAEQATTEPLQELVRRAQEGDRAVLPLLRQALGTNPDIWQRVGDLAAQAQAAWLHLLAGADLFLYEGVQRKLDELKAELAGPAPSPLETLLVERVAACWLQTMYADALYAQARGPESTPTARHELMRRQESAQRRYLMAIKQLALVRKLLKPSLSPYALACQPVPEGKPVAARGEASALRFAAVN